VQGNDVSKGGDTVSKPRGNGKKGKRDKGQLTQTPGPQAPNGRTSPQE
jgi:hypothetical protein